MINVFKKIFPSVAVFLLLLVVVGIVYAPSVRSGFILDDYVWIQPLTLKQLGAMFVGSWEHGNTLRPVMRANFLFDRWLYGEQALWWHITNLWLHATVGWVLYKVVEVVTKNRSLSIVAALLFAVFPANHETVAWISGRTHPFGFLLSFAGGYLLYQAARNSQWRLARLFSGSLILLTAFLTYEVSFAVPVLLTWALICVGPRTWPAWGTAIWSFVLLGILFVYRLVVLGGIGSVGAQQTNLLLAPFANFKQFSDLYWYSRELKIALLTLCLLLGYAYIRQQAWKNHEMKWVYFFLGAAAIGYGPFVISQGVAPRFLYTSLWFCALSFTTAYYVLAKKAPKQFRFVAIGLTIIILTASFARTVQVAKRYEALGQAHRDIGHQVTNDFPTWPAGRDMLFYGIPNSYQNVLAFLTYFDRVVLYNYPGQTTGQVYRADRLSPEQLQTILNTKPVIYKFTGVGQPIILQER